MFHYSKYWGTWSRVLHSLGGWYLEANLTPINGRYDNSSAQLWKEEVAPIILRRHCTVPQPGEMRDKIPPMVVTAMILNVGDALTHRLIADDLLSEIDLTLVREKMQGGGIPISMVFKPRTFVLHWLGGKVQEVKGSGATQKEALANAFRDAGYGGGALRALDYWEEKGQ